MDVHTVQEEEYIKELKDCANNNGKNVYAIYDDGVMHYNRQTNVFDKFEGIQEFTPN